MLHTRKTFVRQKDKSTHTYQSMALRASGSGRRRSRSKEYAEKYMKNICILGDSGDLHLGVSAVVGGDCLITEHGKQTVEDGLVVGNKTVYAPSGLAKMHCG